MAGGGLRAVELAPGIHALDCHGIVWAYLLAKDGRAALIDTGLCGDAAAILDAMAELEVSPASLRAIVATHCHADHVGSLAELLDRTGAESLVHRLDAPVVRRQAAVRPPDLLDFERPLAEAASAAVPDAPPARVDRELEDGDELDLGLSAVVIHVPGHTPGSIAVHLPRERALFTGDAVASIEGRPVVGFFNVDREAALASFHRLARLHFEVAGFGHGPPIRRSACVAFRAAPASGR